VIENLRYSKYLESFSFFTPYVSTTSVTNYDNYWKKFEFENDNEKKKMHGRYFNEDIEVFENMNSSSPISLDTVFYDFLNNKNEKTLLLYGSRNGKIS